MKMIFVSRIPFLPDASDSLIGRKQRKGKVMATDLTNSERVAACIERINELWGLHEPENENAKDPVRCQLFVVDRRWVPLDMTDVELRLGISFGGNPFLPDVPRGFVPPPILPGKYIFGIHVVGTKDHQITLYDQFSDARQASDSITLEEAWEHAKSILQKMSDSEYASFASENPRNPGRVQSSGRWLIEDFEVLPGESL
jgi:hypothetical protein